jgi:chemosensory pili system protein ChpC
MLIPLHEGRLLLPNAAVAEVIGYREPDAIANGADWLQGRVSWRQRDLPVVDFERMLGRPDLGGGIRQRIAVCYALSPDADRPMLGIVAQGIPRLLRVSRQAIESADAGEPGESPVRMTLSVGGESLLVPDLDYLQAQLPAV